MNNYIIPGRAHTPEQKRAIIEQLLTIWLDAPTLRLGQLIYIAANGENLFFIEDEALITELKQHIIPATIPPLQATLDLRDAMLRLAESEDEHP